MIPFDVDQPGWGAQRVFADGALAGLWVPDKWVVHWGGNASLGATVPPDPAKERQALRIYEQSHLSRGWRAIAYNYAVGQSGLTYRLRGENPSGATSGDYEPDGIPENAEARAVLWIGGLGQSPSVQAYEAMAAIVNSDPMLVIAHSDVRQSTQCPGDDWRSWIAAFTPGGNEDDVMIREALQAQTMAWYRALQDKTGSPGGSNPGYWGSDYPGQGPNEQEWADAEQELFTAALTAGVLGPFPAGGTVDTAARAAAGRANERLDGIVIPT